MNRICHFAGAWLAGLVCFGCVCAQGQVPADLETFMTRFEKEAVTPEGSAKLLFDAVFAYMNPGTRDEAGRMLAFIMRQPDDWERKVSQQSFVKRMTAGTHDHVFRSYAKGATPENGYDMDPNRYELVIEAVQPGHPKGSKMLLTSGGADTPRAIFLDVFEGRWFVTDAGAIKLEIRPALEPWNGSYAPAVGANAAPGEAAGQDDPAFDLADWPIPARLLVDGVSLRDHPSHEAGSPGALPEPEAAGEFGVARVVAGDDGAQWCFVQCGIHGQGWVPAEVLFIDADASPLHRLAARVRRDYGHVLALAEEIFGPAARRSSRDLEIPDFNTVVKIVALEFHGHGAEYRDGRLHRVMIAGGFMDFGGIAVGTPAKHIRRVLGDPHSAENGIWKYWEELDDFEFAVEDGLVTAMSYQRAVYE